MKSLRNQRGVALILELILVALVAGVLAIVGYRWYQAKYSVNKGDTNSAKTVETKKKAYVKATNGLNLRSTADDKSTVLAQMPFGSEISDVKKVDDTWSKGVYNKKEGHFQSQFTVNTQGDLTADWKTYKDNKYSYSFKYPADWEAKVADPTVAVGVVVSPAKNSNYANAVVSFYSEAPGMGCTVAGTRSAVDVQIGSQKTMATDFCGAFYLVTTMAGQQDIQLHIYYPGKDQESVGTQILKSIEGLKVK